MQPYTDADRAILTARSIEVDAGLELLDHDDQLIDDITDQLLVDGSKVQRSNYAAAHGSCDLRLLTDLDWPNVRVRPWQSVTSSAGTVRRNLGVYLLTTPERTVTDDDTEARTVQGQDKLHLLQRIVGDTYIASGPVLDAARQAITDSGVTGLPPLFDGTAQDITIPADDPLVWVLDEQDPATWLRVVNDILRYVGYRGLWVDAIGRFRSEPYQSPAVRPPEWVHDLADPRTNIVSPLRKITTEQSGFNWWRFVRDGMTKQPVEGAGRYTVDRTNGSLRRGRVERLQVANQTSLVARGDQLVDADTRRTRLLTIETGPLPILGHFDLAQLLDPKLGNLRVLTRSHTIPLDDDNNVQLELEVV